LPEPELKTLQPTNTVTRNAMKFGAITGMALFIVFVLVNIMGGQPGAGQNFIHYLILITGITLGTKSFRDQELGGQISYSTALWSGTQIAFFCAVIISFFMFIYLKFVDSSMIEKILQQTEQQLIEKEMSDSDIEKTMNMTRKFTNPGMMAVFGVLGNTFMGFLFSLVIAAILKKGNRNFDQFMQENQ
jgi:hypothetical protein